jgi:type 1 glutamine amidotransferase
LLPDSEIRAQDADEAKHVAFIAGRRSHGYGEHEHHAGSFLLARSLEQGMANFKTTLYRDGWPDEDTALDEVDAIVIYCDGGGGHLVNERLDRVGQLMDKGIGLVCIHYAVEVPKGEIGDRMLDWLGGYFEPHWSVNPHWTANFKDLPEHPITRGVEPFEINDEWYYHMRFRPEMEGVTPILTDLPPDSTLSRPDGPHSGNPDVRRAIAARQPQHVAWAYERPDGHRGFGFTGGHFHWNWGDDEFRQVVLNAIVWAAHGEVPERGVEDKPVTREDLLLNQDEQKPEGFEIPDR